MNKFEQLIEYVINDEAEKARELFHDIVVEKSREIYEDLMDIEDECCDTMGGDSSDRFIRDVETDEEGIQMEDGDEDFDVEFDDEEITGDDFDADEEEVDVDFDDENDGGFTVSSEQAVDLEDKLDALMAEFEALMSSDSDEEVEFDDEEVDFDVDGGDELEVDDTEEFINERESTTKRDDRAEKAGRKVAKDIEWDEKHHRFDEESTTKRDNRAEKAGRKVTKDIEWDEKHHRFDENISLSAAPKPVTREPEGTNKKSINANNSGAIGAEVHPVKMTGDTAHGRANPKVGDLPEAGKFKNVPAKDNSKLSAAPKPVTSQASGVNTRTPFPKA